MNMKTLHEKADEHAQEFSVPYGDHGYKIAYESYCIGYTSAKPTNERSRTGIVDKNGIEVMEGDRVKCYDNAAVDPAWGLDKIHTGRIVRTTTGFALNVDGVLLEHWDNAENIEIVRVDIPDLPMLPPDADTYK